MPRSHDPGFRRRYLATDRVVQAANAANAISQATGSGRMPAALAPGWPAVRGGSGAASAAGIVRAVPADATAGLGPMRATAGLPSTGGIVKVVSTAGAAAGLVSAGR